MSYLQLEVTRTDLDGNESDITYDVERVTVRKGADQKANTVQVVLKNSYYKNNRHRWVDSSGELIWQEDDGITIKAKYNIDGTSLSDDDILTIADALEFNVKLEDSRTPLTIKAADKTFNLLNQNWVSVYTQGTGFNAPEIIKNVIDNVNDGQEGDGTFQINAALQIESTYDAQKNSSIKGIQTRRIDDSLFPISSLSKVYKPVYEWIDDLSTIEFTNNFDNRDQTTAYTNSGGGQDSEQNPTQNRKMRYFLDKDNNFRWFYPDDDIDYTIVIGTVGQDEDDVKSYDLTKSTFDIINFVIYNGGKDLYGAGTLNYWFDINTKSKKLLSKYKAYNDISIRVIREEIKNGNLVENSSGSFTFQEVRYNRNGTVTPYWNNNTSYDNDDDYNSAVRAKIDVDCKARAKEFTAGRGNPRWKGNLVIKGRNYQPGETVQLTSYVHGINNQTIRIIDLTHNITKDQWTTTLSVEEDEDKVGVTQ